MTSFPFKITLSSPRIPNIARVLEFGTSSLILLLEPPVLLVSNKEKRALLASNSKVVLVLTLVYWHALKLALAPSRTFLREFAQQSQVP